MNYAGFYKANRNMTVNAEAHVFDFAHAGFAARRAAAQARPTWSQ